MIELEQWLEAPVKRKPEALLPLKRQGVGQPGYGQQGHSSGKSGAPNVGGDGGLRRKVRPGCDMRARAEQAITEAKRAAAERAARAKELSEDYTRRFETRGTWDGEPELPTAPPSGHISQVRSGTAKYDGAGSAGAGGIGGGGGVAAPEWQPPSARGAHGVAQGGALSRAGAARQRLPPLSVSGAITPRASAHTRSPRGGVAASGTASASRAGANHAGGGQHGSGARGAALQLPRLAPHQREVLEQMLTPRVDNQGSPRSHLPWIDGAGALHLPAACRDVGALTPSQLGVLSSLVASQGHLSPPPPLHYAAAPPPPAAVGDLRSP